MERRREGAENGEPLPARRRLADSRKRRRPFPTARRFVQRARARTLATGPHQTVRGQAQRGEARRFGDLHTFEPDTRTIVRCDSPAEARIFAATREQFRGVGREKRAGVRGFVGQGDRRFGIEIPQPESPVARGRERSTIGRERGVVYIRAEQRTELPMTRRRFECVELHTPIVTLPVGHDRALLAIRAEPETGAFEQQRK